MTLERENGSHANADYEPPVRDFFDNPHVLMFEATPSGTLLWVNRGWHLTLGFSESDVRDVNLFDTIDSTSLPQFTRLLDQLMDGVSVGASDLTLRAQTGDGINVTGSLTCVFKDDHLSTKETDYLRRIQASGTNLLILINDILDLSKVEAGKVDVVVEPVSLERIVVEVCRQIEGTEHARNLTLRPVVPDGMVPVMADGDRLKQVLLNLVANAVKFTDRGGVTVRIATDGDTATRIEVADTGSGIPQDRLERVFDPFQQADHTTWRRFGGTGLGLAICRSLCRAMGFSLTATSELGCGSTFTIDLVGDAAIGPLHETRASAAERASDPLDPRDEPGGRAVVAEGVS